MVNDSYLCVKPIYIAQSIKFEESLGVSKVLFGRVSKFYNNLYGIVWRVLSINIFFIAIVLYAGLQGNWYIDDLVLDCSNSSALAMELLQFCVKPSI